MIRIRKSNGEVIELSKDEAIEVVDGDGKVGLILLGDQKDTARAMTPGDPLFTGYCRTWGLQAAKVHFHDQFEGKPMRL